MDQAQPSVAPPKLGTVVFLRHKTQRYKVVQVTKHIIECVPIDRPAPPFQVVRSRWRDWVTPEEEAKAGKLKAADAKTTRIKRRSRRKVASEDTRGD